MDAGMRARQPTILFVFTVIVGFARALSYAGTSAGLDSSPATWARYVTLHVLAFSLAVAVVAALSRATVTRAARVGMGGEFALFLGVFVDVARGAPVLRYEDTYVAGFGSPGALVSAIAYGAVAAWGARDATLGPAAPRGATAIAAGLLGPVALSLLVTPWPLPLLEDATTIPWGVHLVMALYFGVLACVCLAIALAVANRPLHREFWARSESMWLPVLILLPLAGVVASGRFGIPQIAFEPAPGLKIAAPYVLAATALGGLLWVQRRFLRLDADGPLRVEIATIVKVAILLLAFFLGPVAFLLAGLASSLVWLEGDRANPRVFGVIAGVTVLIGDTAWAAVDFFPETVVGPLAFRIAVYAWTVPSLLGLTTAVSTAAVVAFAARATSRTSVSGRGRASS